jgi:hypothetical protein
MKYLPRRLLPGRPARTAALALVAAACGACTKTAAEPAASSQDAGNTTPADPSAASAAWRNRSPRDDAGHLVPKTPPPPDPGGAMIPTPSREPDWDLDTADTARDYVRRYTLGTKRYGETLECIEVGASQPSGDQRRVEVKMAAGCPGAGTVRDVFLVDVAGDRLSVDDKSKRDPLVRWPDGSDPEGPANPTRSVDDMRKWTGPLRDAFRDLLLVPIRVQAYGRGTYAVITLAGWHNQVQPTTPASDLKSVADRLCKANNNAPLGVFGGLDRSTMLRIRCPAAARWDKL